MAVEDGGNHWLPGARVSPGDAAFARLTRRDALRAKDEPASFPSVDAIEFIGPPVTPGFEMHRASEEPAPELPVFVDRPSLPAPADIPVIVASAALVVLTPATDFEKTGSDEPVDRIIAMAAAFGIEAAEPVLVDEILVPAPLPEIAHPAPIPTVVPGKSAAPAMPRSSPADVTAARLEAALLNQLKSLEETLAEDAPPKPARMPRAEPLRLANGTGSAKASDFIGPPRRSTFAPDPVRQRTYVDLRRPAPAPEKAVSDDPPWRKYLAEPRRPATPERVPSRRPVAHAAGKPSPVPAAADDRKADAEERGRVIRAMSAAAVLGLGVGLGLLVLIRPFTDAGMSPTTASVSDPAVPMVATATTAGPETGVSGAGSGSPVNQALATLLADPPVSRAAHGQPAVISEPGTSPVAAATPEAPAPAPVVAAVAEPPVVIRPPPGEERAAARVPDFDTTESGPLAYVPAVPSFDPVRQQLLEQEADAKPAPDPHGQVAARAPAAAESAPANIRSGRAVINDFVNLRAKPDNASQVVAILAEGLSVKVIACDYWCEVEAGGKRGFVFKKFLSR